MFKIGDQVEAIEDFDRVITKGMKGRVITVKISTDSLNIGVRWDIAKDSLHDCDGNCSNHHGYYVMESMLKKIEIKIDPKVRKKKVKEIIKEIKNNKEFKKCFKNLTEINEEVNNWTDEQVGNWKE